MKLKQNDHIIIIGSGVTGLVSGALFAKRGYRVDVLEMHPTLVGGHARTFEVDGIPFCAGPQFLWNFSERLETTSWQILKELGLDRSVNLLPFDEAAQDLAFIGGEPGVPIPKNFEDFKHTAIAQFPQDAKGLDKFFKILKRLFQGAKLLHDSGAFLKGSKEILKVTLLSNHLDLMTKLVILRYFSKHLSDLFDHCRLSEKTRRYCYANSGIFAENEDAISVGVYASAMGYILEGITYPVGGMRVIMDGLVATIEAYHGRVLLNTKVVEILLDGKRAKGVVCEDGAVFEGDFIISTIAPRLTQKLLGQDVDVSFKYEPSNSLVSCFMVISGCTDLEPMLHKNYWWQAFPEPVDYNRPDMQKPPTMMYLGARKFARGEEELYGLTVYTPGNFEQAKAWHALGDDQHAELKTRIFNQIIDTIESNLFPGLGSFIKDHLVLTPWDLYQELSAEKGNVYGRRMDPENVLKNVSVFHGVDNLAVACATTSLPGVETCFQAAAFLVDEIAGV